MQMPYCVCSTRQNQRLENCSSNCHTTWFLHGEKMGGSCRHKIPHLKLISPAILKVLIN
ncbi:hypothetical protein Fmac_007484 [Flemingia macrophylla]|uniref:Uncharacterized protein n=1 Tax=Flemingia macrophylla TaxID=520843 RepID=A0ABD1MUP4_9FABA